MYQVVYELTVNGKREMDSVSTKTWKHKGWAEREARKSTRTINTNDGRIIERKAYVIPLLRTVTEYEAKTAYCKGKHVWADGEYGKKMLMPSGWYGSHAPASELFYREIYHIKGYYSKYDGNYYIEIED